MESICSIFFVFLHKHVSAPLNMSVGRQKKNFQRQKSRQHRGDGRSHSHKAPWPRNRSADDSLCQALVPGAPSIQAPPLSHCFVGLAGRTKAGKALEKETSMMSSPPWLLRAWAPLRPPPTRLPPPGSTSDAEDPESFTVWRGKEHQARWNMRQVTAAHRWWGSRHCIGAQGMAHHTGPFLPSGAGSLLSSRGVFSETSS